MGDAHPSKFVHHWWIHIYRMVLGTHQWTYQLSNIIFHPKMAWTWECPNTELVQYLILLQENLGENLSVTGHSHMGFRPRWTTMGTGRRAALRASWLAKRRAWPPLRAAGSTRWPRRPAETVPRRRAETFRVMGWSWANMDWFYHYKHELMMGCTHCRLTWK